MLLYDSSCIVNGGKAGSVQKKKGERQAATHAIIKDF